MWLLSPQTGAVVSCSIERISRFLIVVIVQHSMTAYLKAVTKYSLQHLHTWSLVLDFHSYFSGPHHVSLTE